MQTANDGTRTLTESIMVPELIVALKDWQNKQSNGVLIGRLALSYYVKPRMTQDIDILMLSNVLIPDEINGFKKTGEHAFQHNQTHVEIEIIIPEFVGLPVDVVQKIIETAIESDGIKIASPSSIVASKLFRNNIQDIVDMVNLVNNTEVNISDYVLPLNIRERFIKVLAYASDEK